MTHYLIEFRFHGVAKFKLKELIYEINRKFKLKEKRAIPHITLAGPFYTQYEKKLIGDFNRLCSNSSLMSFKTGNYDFFKNGNNNNVVFLNINPTEELKEFRRELSQKIKSYCNLSSFDEKKEFVFHTTLAMKLSNSKFVSIKRFLENKSKLNFKHVIVRATLIKGGIILREYDFLLKRPLIRRLAKSKIIYAKTLKLLKSHFERNY